jgi:hypothetical protein
MTDSHHPRVRLLSAVIFVSIIIAGSGLFATALFSRGGLVGPGHFGITLPNKSNSYFFGSPGTDFAGWLIPPRTLVSTSYTTNHTLNGFVSATLNVFPYQLPQGGLMYLGLYADGKLAANSTYDLGQSVAYPASILRNLVNGSGNALASFTPSLEGYSVNLVLHSSLPSGTRVTVTAYVSNPIWVQIDSKAPGLSYTEPTSSPVPPSLGPEGALAPYTLSIQVQSNAA